MGSSTASRRFTDLEALEARRMFSAAIVDVGPLFQAPSPDTIGFSGAGNSASKAVTFPSGNSFIASITGPSLTWVDYANTKPSKSANQLVYRDGVYQAGNLTLSFSGLSLGTYALTLTSIDEGAAGSSGSPFGATFNVQVTDATRTGVTVISGARTATMYSLTAADLAPFTFAPKADGSATVTLSRVGTSGNVWLNGFTLDDQVVVNDTTAPTLTPSPWATAPSAFKAGVAAVTMVAGTASDASGVQYFFENATDPTRNSGWISSPSWSDYGLSAGATYQYRYKTRDRSLNQNQSAWSTTAGVTTATDNTFAGFTPAEVGPRSPTFDFSGIRQFPNAPAAGVHPRIYTSPEELPDIRRNLVNTQAGQESMATVDAYSRLLVSGTSGYNRSAFYAVDAYGTGRLGNVGYADSSKFYAGLLNYNWNASPAPVNPLPFNADGTVDFNRRGIFASTLAVAAYQCWVYQGQPEFDQRARDIATVMDNWARLVKDDPALISNGSANNLIGGASFAETYDFAYNAMTPSQRASVQFVLAKVVPTAANMYGVNTDPIATTSNWSTLDNFKAVTMMAIEGEPGSNPADFRAFLKTQYKFLTYGWYETGAPNEGLGKNYQFLSTMAAFARRGYPLVGHPSVRAFATHYTARIMQPFGSAFTEYDDWGGTGASNSPTGGYKFNVMDSFGAKYLFPNSPAADFVYQNAQTISGNPNPYATTAGMRTDGYFNPLLVTSIQSSDYNTDNLTAANFQSASATANRNELSFFEPNRGLVISRSGFDQNALTLNFQSRQDLGGHTHADRNNFTLSGLGRTWAVYRSLGSGGANGTIGDSRYHNVTLIDGVGQGIDGAVAKTPGKINEVVSGAAGVFASGDAKYAYDWSYNGDPGYTRSTLPPGVDPADESLNDFRLQKNTTDAWYEQSLYDRPFWNGNSGSVEGFQKIPWNPVQLANRTTALVRGAKPYALVLDDYQKDASVHNYKWLMQLPDDLSIESTSVNSDPSNYSNDIVLKESAGNRRLLVRVLSANGLVATNGAPGYVESIVQPITGTWQRLVIEANAVNPQFKIMLLPFTVGDTLPTTTVSDSKFTNTLQGQTDTITFQTGADGRTRYALAHSSGQTLSEQFDATAPAAPTGLSVNVRSQTTSVLTWNDVANSTAQIYKIQRSTDGVTFTTINTTLQGVTQYIDKTMTAGTRYSYRVVASNTLDSTPSNAVVVSAWPTATIVIQPGAQTYTQNFDVLQRTVVQNVNWAGDSWLPGWSLTRNDNVQFRSDTGVETYPRPFAEGATSGVNNADVALGGLTGGNGWQSQGVLFRNDLAFPITSADLSYVAEQWRKNVNGGSIKLYYKMQASNPSFDLGASTAGWSTVSSLDFNASTSTAGTALDGRSSANSGSRATTLTVNVPSGQFLWIAWRIVGGTNSNNPSLAVDDVSISFNSAPLIVRPSSANPSDVTGTTTDLTVVADDDGGEANLLYTWALANGPAPVTYSRNGTNVAKSTTATFSRSGTYTFNVTATDAYSKSVVSSVSVTVVATATGVVVSPASPSVAVYKTQQLAASVVDQFGLTLVAQPTVTWSTSTGGGSISSSGLYTAPATTGTATVAATVGALITSTTVTVAPTPTAFVDLSSLYNYRGYYTDNTIFSTSSGLTRQGNALPASQMPTTITFKDVTFTTLPAETNNVFLTTSKYTTLPSGHFTNLLLIGLCTNTTQTSPFIIYYTDGTSQTINQGLSRWTQPSNYSGETTLNPPTFTYQVNANGSKTTGNRYMYGYDLPLDGTKTVSQIKWPNSANNAIFAAALTWRPPTPGNLTSFTQPIVQSFAVNDASTQRSTVNNLLISFDQPVTLSTGAASLVRRASSGTAATPISNFVLSPTNGGATYSLTFPSTNDFVGASLADGVYDLVVNGALVKSVTGNVAGTGTRTFLFHRLFGDVNGDATTNNFDYLAFSRTYGTSLGSTGYNSAFDANGDGTINNYDYLQFSNRFGTTLV